MTEQLTALELADELDRVAKWSDSEHWGTLNEAAAKLRRLHEEVTEQGRLLSMSAERELSLLAKIDRLKKLNAELLKAHYWISNRCFEQLMDHPLHQIHKEMAHDAGAYARTAIAKAGEQA